MEFQRETETEDSVCLCLKSYKIKARVHRLERHRFTVIIVGDGNGAVSVGIWLQTYRLLEYSVNQFRISFLGSLLIYMHKLLS